MPNIVKGVAPGLILIPAREYEWELKQRVQFTIPNKGKVSELLNEKELAEGVKFPGEDEFCIFEDNTLLLWETVRVLFANSDYPALKDDECLNVVAMEFDENQVTLHGEVLRYL